MSTPSDIGIMVTVFANGQGNLASIPGQVILKTQKLVLDATLLNTQHYKVRIKGKVEQSRERSGTLPLHLSVVATKKGAFGSASAMVANFTFYFLQDWSLTIRCCLSHNQNIQSLAFLNAICNLIEGLMERTGGYFLRKERKEIGIKSRQRVYGMTSWPLSELGQNSHYRSASHRWMAMIIKNE